MHVRGGELTVELAGDGRGTIRLGGPVVHVFDVTIPWPTIRRRGPERT